MRGDQEPAGEGALGVFGRVLGEAFQLRDDALDGAPDAATGPEIDDLLSRGARALDGAPLRPEGVAALVAIADALRMEAAG